ncbi:MAG: zf-HC2 domain-containing protein, partial [bacterium]
MNCDDCVDCVELIARKLDRSLSADEEKALAGHLAECPACRAELLLQQRIAESLSAAPGPALAADFTRRVAARAFAQDRSWSGARRLGYLIPVAAFAVVVLAAVAYRAEMGGLLAPLVGG